jgi:hypothetical protein
MADVCYMSDDLDNDDDFMVDDDDDDDVVDSGDDDDFDVPVAPKKTSKTTSNKNVLKESTNNVSSTTTAPTNKAKRTKAVEETYQKLTPHEVSTFLVFLISRSRDAVTCAHQSPPSSLVPLTHFDISSTTP